MDEPSSASSTAALQGGLALTHWTLDDLWVAVVAIGGDLPRREIARITAGSRPATSAEHDVLAVTLNDYLADHEPDHPVAFWYDLPR